MLNTIVNYNFDLDIDTTRLSMVPFETYIYGEFNKRYINWKNKLTNNMDNIYSFTTKEKNNIIESKIFNSVLLLITAVISYENIPNFFDATIKNILLKTKKYYLRCKFTNGCCVDIDSS